MMSEAGKQDVYKFLSSARRIWKDQGGGQYGPHTETMQIEERKFDTFMLLAISEYEKGRTPDPRVMKLVEAAREVMRAYDESSGNEPSISVLMRLIGTDFRTALKAMEAGSE